MCSSECGMKVSIFPDGHLRLNGNPDNPMNRGGLCPRAFLAETLRLSKERVVTPLRRLGFRGEGRFVPISWDEAFTGIADSLNLIRTRYGAESLTMLFGEKPDHDMAWDFAAFYGTPNIFDHNSLCDTNRRLGFAGLFGSNQERPLPDLQRPLLTDNGVRTQHDCRLLLLFGENPAEARRFYWLWPCIREAQRAGMKLVVVDPYRSASARMADTWLPIRPGTDAALLLFLLRDLLELSHIAPNVLDQRFLHERATGFEELKALILTSRRDPRNGLVFHTLPWAAHCCGLPVKALRALARDVENIRPWCGMVGMNGVAHHADGFLATQLLGVLIAATGMLDVPGGLMLRDMPSLARPVDYFIQRLGKQWFRQKDLFGISSTARHGVVSAIPGDILQGISLKKGPFAGEHYFTRGLFVLHGNPFLTAPESQLWVKAVTEKDGRGRYQLFSFVVCSTTLNETARYADYVLPLTHFLERQGLVLQETVNPVLALRERVVPPPVGCLAPLALFQGLARYLFPDLGIPWSLGARSDDELCNTELAPLAQQFEGLSPCRWLRMHGGLLSMPARYRKYSLSGWKGANNYNLFPAALANWHQRVFMATDCEDFDVQWPVNAPKGLGNRIFHLISGRNRWHTHSLTQALWPEGSPHRKLFLIMNTQDARVLSLHEGDAVRIRNERGDGQVALLHLSNAIRRGVLRGTHGWGRADGKSQEGIYNINYLTQAKAIDCITGNALFGDLRVVLERVSHRNVC